MDLLKIEKNKIVDFKGKEFILKGININSPCILKFEENHNFLEDLKNIKKLGANAVRIPICPAYFQSKNEYCKEILDPIVLLCKKLSLYCVLDYHAQGNPIKNITREPNKLINGFKKYDSNFEAVKKASEVLAKRYGSQNHVLFEPFSAYLETTKEEYQKASEDFVKIIRKYTDNIIIISAVGWPQTLEHALNYNVSISNIAFGIMIYPGTTDNIKKIVIQIKKKYPVVITECGYENKNPKEQAFSGTKDYANKLKIFVEKNNISWFAWCYHPTRQPVLLRSWNPNDLSEWGRFVKEELL